jgi:hypothetical protein
MLLITEELRQKIIQCIAGATHTTVPFHAVNDLLTELSSVKPEPESGEP